MAKLLHIEASPRKDRSKSIAVAKAFLETYAQRHPTDEVDTLDLWTAELPPFDGAALNAKYAVLHGQTHTAEQKAAWDRIATIADRLKAADKVLLSLPMWNFGIPYPLKHYFDVITQPGIAFSYSPESGYRGLITDKPAAVIYARGGSYVGGGEAMDFQKPYVEFLLRFIGFTDITSIVIEPTLDPTKADAAIDAAKQAARELAAIF